MPQVYQAGLLLLIAYVGFVSLGLPDTVVGVAWPSVRDTFQLRQSALAFVFIGAGIGYFLSSFFAGRLLSRWGVGILLAASTALVSSSAFGFAFAPIWAFFAACSIAHGVGSGAIDAGLNSYAAHHFSARQMNWLHACYSIGATFGPLLMTMVLTRSGSWRSGYALVGGIMLLLTLLFLSSHRRWDEDHRGNPAADAASDAEPASMRSALADRGVWLHIVLFFFYTGLELTIGQWSFTLLTESRQIDARLAGLWVTVYWASIAVGRILFGFVVDRIGIDRLVRWSTVAAVLGTTLIALPFSDALTFCGLALAGLALAPIYPCLMTRTPARLGRSVAAHAIGFQVAAAMTGAAALPSVAGLLAQYIGLEYVAAAAIGTACAVFLLHETILRSFPRATLP